MGKVPAVVTPVLQYPQALGRAISGVPASLLKILPWKNQNVCNIV